jgi:hypothetical protein
MAIRLKGHTPSEIMDMLRAQATDPQRQVDLIERKRAAIREMEEKYGITSADVHNAIDEGRIEETYDVTMWLMDIHLLARIENGDR